MSFSPLALTARFSNAQWSPLAAMLVALSAGVGCDAAQVVVAPDAGGTNTSEGSAPHASDAALEADTSEDWDELQHLPCAAISAGQTIDSDVVVSRGCTLHSATINGDLYIEPGASLVAEGVTVNGDIEAVGAERIVLRSGDDFGDTLVQGNITIDGGTEDGGNVSMLGVQVNGSVTVAFTPGLFSSIGTDYNSDLTVVGNEDRVELLGSLVKGELVLEDNTIFQMIDSVVAGNLSIFRTEKIVAFLPGEYTPERPNRIGGDLLCASNELIHSASLKVGGERAGQCAR